MKQDRRARIFDVASQLEASDLLATEQGLQRYSALIGAMATVLRGLGERRAGDPAWRSLLEMPSLLHEVEEAIVPLRELVDALNESPHIAEWSIADLCCGKGILPLLISHLARFHRPLDRVKRILMVDRASRAQVNWVHVGAANTDVAAAAADDVSAATTAATTAASSLSLIHI